ncbi:uncharacterized protein LOC135704674 [Ochlerotatus camptorhynchus]|uniref:uncharacterized protein LOC135704674 n=1 Tax=Ochlerotatus camptorhynchus TaxID=644619 RepID=UPI0031D67A2A
MAPNRIFMVELIVEELQMFSVERTSDPEETVPENSEPESCPERCIRFQLGNFARCEVCEKDFGSQLDENSSKLGENCMFTLNEDHYRENELNYEISALEKQTDGRKKVLGKWDESASEILRNLAKNYDDINGRRGSEASIGTALSVDSISKKNVPVSETFRSLYPLRNDSEIVRGCVIVTFRISCLGERITQKIKLGAKDDQPGVTCFKTTDQEDREHFMKCVVFDEVAHPHPVLCGECEPEANVASLPPTPPASVTSKEEICSPYDEYTAELNGNAIAIRIEKNSELKVMLDNDQDDNCTKGCWTSLKLPEGVYALEERDVQREQNACHLPVIRGNLKYPAQQWSADFLMCKQKRPICAEDYRKRTDPTRSVCMQTRNPEAEPHSIHPCGIEICKKGWHDPNVDVFVLKLGKNKTTRAADGGNQIELELRTPKGPMYERRPKETRGVQVIEAEFEDLQKPAEEIKQPKKKAAAAGGAKKGGKKK